MKYLPLLNFLILGIIPYLVRHEKCHAKLDLLIEQVCKKLDISTGK